MVPRILLALVLLVPAVAAAELPGPAACEPVTTGNNFPYVGVNPECLPAAMEGDDGSACEPVRTDTEPPYVEVHPECIGSGAAAASVVHSTACDPVNIDDEFPFVYVYEECIPAHPMMRL